MLGVSEVIFSITVVSTLTGKVEVDKVEVDKVGVVTEVSFVCTIVDSGTDSGDVCLVLSGGVLSPVGSSNMVFVSLISIVSGLSRSASVCS